MFHRRMIAAVLTSPLLVILLLAPGARAGDFNYGDVIAGVSNGSYNIYDNAGNYLETINDGMGGFTTGCATNQDGTLLYTTNFTNTKVIVFDVLHPHNVTQVIDTGIVNPGGQSESVIFDAAGNFYVGHPDGDHDIQKYDAAGTYLQSFDVAIEDRGSDWMDLALDQRTMFYTSEGFRVMRYDVVADAQLADFAVLPERPCYALKLLPPYDGSAGLLVANTSSVKRLDSAGAVIQSYDAPGEGNWFALNLDPDGTSFWSGSFDTDNFYKFDIATGAVLVGPVNAGPGGTLYGLCVYGELGPDLISLGPDTADNLIDTEHTVTATVVDFNGDAIEGRLVEFEVFDGPNMGTGGDCSDNMDCTTDAAGQVSFTYLGDGGVGQDRIRASMEVNGETILSNTVFKFWYAAPGLSKSDGLDGDCAEPGSSITYTICYDNLGNPDEDLNDVVLVDHLPTELIFDSASDGGSYDMGTHSVSWNIGTLPAGAMEYCVTLVAQVEPGTPGNTLVTNTAELSSEETGSVETSVETEVCGGIVADLDIHPTSCPNPFNPISNGKTPAAILGSDVLDVSMIDPATVLLEGVAPIRWSVDDVSQPGTQDECPCSTDGPDGYLDLSLKFSTRELVEALAPFTDGEIRVLNLTARLTDGTELEAADCIIVRFKGAIPAETEGIPLTTVPNPFNPVTTIKYSLPRAQHVRLEVYDVSGRLVERLFDGQQDAGEHGLIWNAAERSSGKYFLRMEADGRTQVQAMTLLK